MLNKRVLGLQGEIAITHCQLYSAYAQLSPTPMGKWREVVRIENEVVDAGEGRSDGHRFVGSQQLAAGVCADFRRPVGIDDLPSGAAPGLDQVGGKCLSRRNNVAADRVREILLGLIAQGA